MRIVKVLFDRRKMDVKFLDNCAAVLKLLHQHQFLKPVFNTLNEIPFSSRSFAANFIFISEYYKEVRR